MSNTNELNDKLVSELRTIAKSFGIAEADSLRKAELITKIVEQQQLIDAARQQQETTSKNHTETEHTEPVAVEVEVVEAIVEVEVVEVAVEVLIEVEVVEVVVEVEIVEVVVPNCRLN